MVEVNRGTRQILEERGYRVEGSEDYYSVYLRKKNRSFPLVAAIYKGKVYEADDRGSFRRRLRTRRHVKQIRDLLNLEEF